MDLRFKKIFDYLLLVEGGYSNDKYDKGGETKYGIIKEEARRYGYNGSMKDLPFATAQEIYYKKYYLKFLINQIKNDKVALSVMDFIVNAGSNGVKKAQQTCNALGSSLSVDKIIGSKTISAINSYGADSFLMTYHRLQREYYKTIVENKPNQKKFLKGWLNRVDRKEKYIRDNF